MTHPVWTDNKASLISRYIYCFELVTHHGTYIDGFAGPSFGLECAGTVRALGPGVAGLVPGDRVWVNLDLAQHGIGTASCGPGVLAPYRLQAEPARFAVTLRRI